MDFSRFCNAIFAFESVPIEKIYKTLKQSVLHHISKQLAFRPKEISTVFGKFGKTLSPVFDM